MSNIVCRCPAYPWPHHLGGGKCDRASTFVEDTPTSPTRVVIIHVLDFKNGVYLSQANDGYYYVGLDYDVDTVFTTFENPQTDFCSTADLSIAKRYFEQHTGGFST